MGSERVAATSLFIFRNPRLFLRGWSAVNSRRLWSKELRVGVGDLKFRHWSPNGLRFWCRHEVPKFHGLGRCDALFVTLLEGLGAVVMTQHGGSERCILEGGVVVACERVPQCILWPLGDSRRHRFLRQPPVV